MSRLDYSKWDHIEVSDDEDDTHPNVDTPSLFRWRHQARVERMEERDQEWNELNKGKEEYQKKLQQVESKLQDQRLNEAEHKKALMTKEELKKQEDEFQKKEEELKKKDKLTPWNVDTICKEKFSRSIINKDKPKPDKEKSEDEIFDEQFKFQEKYRKDLMHFGMLSKSTDSRRFLQENPHLVCDKTANFLVIWCIDLEVEEKHRLMETVAHQTIVLQFILQLAIQMKTDPRNCYNAFFNRFDTMEADYLEAFNDELNAFKGRVKERARIRLEDARQKAEEEQRQKELGPGGLHPADVMETLPKDMQDCFETQNIPMLQEVLKSMDPDLAKYHMNRCVASGLWVPGSKSKDGDEEAEEVYETPEDDTEKSIEVDGDAKKTEEAGQKADGTAV